MRYEINQLNEKNTLWRCCWTEPQSSPYTHPSSFRLYGPICEQTDVVLSLSLCPIPLCLCHLQDWMYRFALAVYQK